MIGSNNTSVQRIKVLSKQMETISTDYIEDFKKNINSNSNESIFGEMFSTFI
jgi:hypothetical protein